MYVSFIIVKFSGCSFRVLLLGMYVYVSFICVVWVSLCGWIGEMGDHVVGNSGVGNAGIESGLFLN